MRIQTLSCDIKLPCWRNNARGNYFPLQFTVWGCNLSTKGRMNFQAKTVVPDQTCTLLRSSDLGRHTSHTLPTAAALVTAQAAQNGGQETQTCGCTAQKVSSKSKNSTLTHLLLNLHPSRNWTLYGGRTVDSQHLLSTYPNCIKSCYLIPSSTLHPPDSFLSSPHETSNDIFHK